MDADDTLQNFFTALVRRMRYRNGFPFIASALLAIVIAGWSYVFGATSIWTFALLALISTAFALLCGGRFRTFYIAITVTPPFLIALPWFLRVQFAMPDYPIKGFVEYFLYFVAAPILVVWMIATLLNRKERHA